MKTLAASLLVAVAAVASTGQQTAAERAGRTLTRPMPPDQIAIDYRFDQVKRKVMLTTTGAPVAVAKGQHAQGGDKVSTGWLSYALIASDRYRAKFEIFSSTDVRLASETPGVILSLERGRLHAIFDKLTGNEPRVVKTPGALLAVRGTQYDVEVDAAGRTTLDVWEGVVEIRSDLRPEPMLVRAGQQSTFKPREAPSQPRPIPEERRHGAPGASRPGDSTHDGHGGMRPGMGSGHDGGSTQRPPMEGQPGTQPPSTQQPPHGGMMPPRTNTNPPHE